MTAKRRTGSAAPGRRPRRKARVGSVRGAGTGEPAIIADLVHHVAERFAKAGLVLAHGTTDPVAEAAFIVAEVLHIPLDRVEARAGARVSSTARQQVLAVAAQRVRTRKPAAYLLRRMYLRGVPFYVDERVIVPRSYLGEILDGPLFAGGGALLAGGTGSVRSILDLCTGSGCLAILAALRFPKAHVDAVDISSDALDVAARNVRDHRLAKRVRLLHGDLFAPVKSARYDLIIANPPYVDAKGMAALPAECRHEPRLALDGGRDGLAVVRRILDEAGVHLTTEGGLLCEIGRGRRALMRAYPAKRFLWLDTEASEGEVFWLDTAGFSQPFVPAKAGTQGRKL